MTPEQGRDAVVRAVAALGRPAAATGAYRQCLDAGGAVRYVAEARLDGPDPVAALRRAGWVLEPEPSTAPSGNTTWRGLQADLIARLTAYPDQPFALLQVLGPCLPAPDGYLDLPVERLPTER